MQSVYIEQPLRRYLLNMQVLADELEARQQEHVFYNRNEQPLLDSIRFYRPRQRPEEQYVYLVLPEDCDRDFRSYENIHFIVFGVTDLHNFSFTSSVISLPEHCDPMEIYNVLQQVFDKYHLWAKSLQWAMQSQTPLIKMLEVSREIFENPLFIHDTDFYILACPRWVEGMLQWEKEPRTGRDMVPLDLINEFKVDQEYLSTLVERHVAMFSAAIRGYRILYSNLWNGDRYDGRVCVDELERPLRKSDYLHLAYLSDMLTMSLSQQKLLWRSMDSDLERFLTEALDGGNMDYQDLQAHLRYLAWDQHDTYLVLKIAPESVECGSITPAGLFGYIEAQIAEGRAFLYRQDIAVVVNLTAAKTTTPAILSGLAYILREGLFRMGVSSELTQFTDLHDGYTQASVALSCGKSSGSMLWYYHFEDYALDYLLDCGRRQIQPRLLGSEKLRHLQAYDEENNTELYHTLEVYLQLERNVVQTSKALFIHRSTLFYRLDRIRKLVELDLDQESVRLYLQLSFLLNRMKQ